LPLVEPLIKKTYGRRPTPPPASSCASLIASVGCKQIVDAGHRREVDRADIIADELAKGQIHPNALHVSGYETAARPSRT